MIESMLLIEPDEKEKPGSIDHGLAFSESIDMELGRRFVRKKIEHPPRSERGMKYKDRVRHG